MRRRSSGTRSAIHVVLGTGRRSATCSRHSGEFFVNSNRVISCSQTSSVSLPAINLNRRTSHDVAILMRAPFLEEHRWTVVASACRQRATLPRRQQHRHPLPSRGHAESQTHFGGLLHLPRLRSPRPPPSRATTPFPVSSLSDQWVRLVRLLPKTANKSASLFSVFDKFIHTNFIWMMSCWGLIDWSHLVSSSFVVLLPFVYCTIAPSIHARRDENMADISRPI